ncbi:MAG: helix-turn-helix domain-containing protein [Pseudomonadota bacterium]|nr:helix-turn-helix domain-containing protein [Pseudomonadota bacterium]
MTPFGEQVRKLRAERGRTLKDMAEGVGVSAAYLSALEHGRRGRPSWYLIQRIIAYFNIIWDEAEELVRLAHLSHPGVVARTGGLSPRATELCNKLAANVARLREDDLEHLLTGLSEAIDRSAKRHRR